jgi:phosphoribosyl 1,2-cyclic phosphodiesterase
MSLKVCVLGSSSSGNCTYVASNRTAILIDAGFSGRETSRRLAEIGVDIEGVSAICVTHEHGDHTAGLSALHRRGKVALFANSGTIQGVEARAGADRLAWNVFMAGSPFEIGDLRIDPFSVPHDAYDPVGFVVSGDGCRVGVVTDMGMVTGLIRERLRPCNAIVIEANHDELLLKNADRPWHLKQRIFSRQGHLSNEHAADVIAEIAGPHLAVVYLAHLSDQCNRPELAVSAVDQALKGKGVAHVSIRLTSKDKSSEIWEGGIVSG